MRAFLRMNGRDIHLGEDEAYDLVIGVATGTVSVEMMADQIIVNGTDIRG